MGIKYQTSNAVTGFLLLVCILTGCQNSANVQPDKGGEFNDEIGRAIVLEKAPKRIISLAPSVTETLFALGLGERIVGVTSYCDFPAAAKTKEKVGDTLTPNLERIIALKPDLIVITTASQLELITRKLDQLSIPVYVTNPQTVRDVMKSIRSLGKLTGTESKASEIADEMESRIAEVERRVKNRPRPRVFYVLQSSPLITAGRNTFINDLINLAGGQSISGDEEVNYPQFSKETVIARAPDVIVVPASHGSDLVNPDDLKRSFSTTPAIRKNRIVRVNPDLVDRPGPRIVDGLEELARGLHPLDN